jgi:hypothetical protein
MNNKQRKEWDGVIDSITKSMNETPIIDINLLVSVNAYILKLERELQNIKGHKRIAAVLKPKEVN